MPGLRRRIAAVIVLPTVAVALAPAAQASSRPSAPTAATTSKPAAAVSGRYIVSARTAADYKALKAKALKLGAKITTDIPELRTVAVRASAGVRASLAADRRTASIATNRTRTIDVVDPLAAPRLNAPGLRSASKVTMKARPAARVAAGVRPDPAFAYPGLLWDYRRIGLPQGWRTTAGDPRIRVGVADTGLDYTHAELRGKVTRVLDFSGGENSYCKQATGTSDEDLARQQGGPANGDWNGHGSWIGGNIAARLDGQGTNGIAPRVQLVALKIAQWCGTTDDASILDAFVTAANMRLDVVSISFGGYLDIRDRDQRVVYYAYEGAVRYARSRGTVIVASAGNEHVRVGAGGRVLSHGELTAPGDPDPATNYPDLYGYYEVPGGITGVIDVAATNRTTVPASATCPTGTAGTPTSTAATCKPASDPHQAAGQGRHDQLAYYSNYGPRIDIAAPGGARKFNLPVWDRGGTPGFPVTSSDLTNAWQTFSITSNWAVQIPCYTFTVGSGFPQGQCYSTIQGTSMAAPHVSAALALIASAHPKLRHRPAALISLLKAKANRSVHNETRAVSATDTSPGDLTGAPCPSGYCHLGGGRISDREAYGAGLVNISRP